MKFRPNTKGGKAAVFTCRKRIPSEGLFLKRRINTTRCPAFFEGFVLVRRVARLFLKASYLYDALPGIF